HGAFDVDVGVDETGSDEAAVEVERPVRRTSGPARLIPTGDDPIRNHNVRGKDLAGHDVDQPRVAQVQISRAVTPGGGEEAFQSLHRLNYVAVWLCFAVRDRNAAASHRQRRMAGRPAAPAPAKKRP